MISISDALRQKLHRYGQEHLLAGWDRLNIAQQQTFLAQLEGINFDLVQQLYDQREKQYGLPDPGSIKPLRRPEISPNDHPALRQAGEQAYASGQLAVLIVAGGQGTRLGFDQPKGMFPIGPISNKTLFQIHAEKVLALRRRFGTSVPLLIMTSPATDVETRQFFTAQGYFGLPEDEVFFFCQGTMPACDLATGRLLLESPGQLFLSPNGHGGTLTGLADSGLLDLLKNRGVRTIFYFQVDNPLIHLADFVFLGRHVTARAEVSTKVIPKQTPTEKLGNLVLVDDRCTIIEYSDLPEDLARQTDEQGQLRLWAGNPAIHIFDVEFLAGVTQGPGRLPWHLARKKVPHVDEHGKPIQPERENALKFEMFIFDVLPMAERWTVWPTSRADEFEPLKNATGPESPASVKQAISNLAGHWLESAGVRVPRGEEGHVAVPLEISPLYALDAEELARKIDRTLRIDGKLYLA